MRKILILTVLVVGLFPNIKKGNLSFSSLIAYAQDMGDEECYSDDAFGHYPVECDHCDTSSPDYDLSQCEDEACDESSASYDPDACEDSKCSEFSANYDPAACEAQACDPNSPNYDPVTCDQSGGGCDQNAPSWDPSSCDYNNGGGGTGGGSTGGGGGSTGGGGGGNNTPTPACGTNSIVRIVWQPANYTYITTGGNSSTVLDSFTVVYSACADVANNVWRLRVTSITGVANIIIDTGGSTDPIVNPPTNQAQADSAIIDMMGYYTRGRGAWHTAAATKEHEDYHYKQLKCAAEHYWTLVEACLEQFTVPLSSYTTDASALTALKAYNAKARINQMKLASQLYAFNLGDSPGDPPYIAGQLILNNAISSVQTLAAAKGWTVTSGAPTPTLPATVCTNPTFPTLGSITTCP